jgi:flagellar basal-body rod protein FlgG
MTVPQNAISINVSQTGLVTAIVAGQTAPQQVGQLTLANFANDAGLQPLGGNFYAQTEASGQPVTGLPGDPGFGTVSQGYLESSNVDPVKEITDLISAQRAYEMNSKVIQAASEMSSTLSQDLK